MSKPLIKKLVEEHTVNKPYYFSDFIELLKSNNEISMLCDFKETSANFYQIYKSNHFGESLYFRDNGLLCYPFYNLTFQMLSDKLVKVSLNKYRYYVRPDIHKDYIQYIKSNDTFHYYVEMKAFIYFLYTEIKRFKKQFELIKN